MFLSTIAAQYETLLLISKSIVEVEVSFVIGLARWRVTTCCIYFLDRHADRHWFCEILYIYLYTNAQALIINCLPSTTKTPYSLRIALIGRISTNSYGQKILGSIIWDLESVWVKRHMQYHIGVNIGFTYFLYKIVVGFGGQSFLVEKRYYDGDLPMLICIN